MEKGLVKKTDDFDPDAYLASKSDDFDPDAYLASKEEKPMVTGEGLLRGSLKALPAAASILGGAVGTALGPAGTLGGGMLGAAGGRALQNIGESMMGDEKTREDIYMGPVKEAAVESAGAGVAGLIGKTANLAGKYVVNPIIKTVSRIGAPEKAAAPLIKEASERLGVEPTRGMLTNEPFVQKIESGLSQGPTAAGQQVATKLQKVREGMTAAGEEALSLGKTSETPIQLAQTAKEQTKKSILGAIEPAAEIYKKLEGDARAIGIQDISRSRISKNIRSLPFAKIKGSPESGFANQIADNLDGVQSLEELRNLRSYVGKQFNDRNISPTMRETAGELYGRLSKLEQNSITRSALAASANAQHGRSVAKEMLGEIKKANKIYSDVSKDLQSVGKAAGFGNIKSYGDFIRKMDEMPDEVFMSKLFNTANVKNLKTIQSKFPETFEVMRKAKVADIYERSITKGEVSIPKMIANARKMSPEARALVFGAKSDQKLKDIETVYNAIYQKVGPSGTPEGLLYTAFNPFSPSAWLDQLTAGARKYILDNPDLMKGTYDRVVKSELQKNIPKEMSQQIIDETKKRFMYSTTPRATGLLMDANNE